MHTGTLDGDPTPRNFAAAPAEMSSTLQHAPAAFSAQCFKRCRGLGISSDWMVRELGLSISSRCALDGVMHGVSQNRGDLSRHITIP